MTEKRPRKSAQLLSKTHARPTHPVGASLPTPSSNNVKTTRRSQQFYPTFDRSKLERAAGVSFDERDVEQLSAVVANYMHDLAAEFEPPSAWTWSRKMPLIRKMEKARLDYLVQEVEIIWRARGGTGRGGYYKDEVGKFTGPLVTLLEEMLNQAGAPAKNRSNHSLYRTITGRR